MVYTGQTNDATTVIRMGLFGAATSKFFITTSKTQKENAVCQAIHAFGNKKPIVWWLPGLKLETFALPTIDADGMLNPSMRAQARQSMPGGPGLARI